jgi:hypothetical protein
MMTVLTANHSEEPRAFTNPGDKLCSSRMVSIIVRCADARICSASRQDSLRPISFGCRNYIATFAKRYNAQLKLETEAR